MGERRGARARTAAIPPRFGAVLAAKAAQNHEMFVVDGSTLLVRPQVSSCLTDARIGENDMLWRGMTSGGFR